MSEKLVDLQNNAYLAKKAFLRAADYFANNPNNFRWETVNDTKVKFMDAVDKVDQYMRDHV